MQTVNQITQQKILKSIYELSSLKFFWVSVFTVLTAIAAQITIPAKPVPYTLQTMIVVISGALLGSKRGAYSQLLYLALGIVGLPVFAQSPDLPVGFARILGPTGGYLLAFPIAAFAVGYLIELKVNYWSIVAAMFIGELIIIAIGVLHLSVFYTLNFEESIKVGGAVFSVWMAVKVFLAVLIYSAVSGIKKTAR